MNFKCHLKFKVPLDESDKEADVMTQPNIATEGFRVVSEIPWQERLRDHNNKIDEYLQNSRFRGCDPKSTVYSKHVLLRSIFARVPITDMSDPTGLAHILLWDLLSPESSSFCLSQIISSLQKDQLAPSTTRGYMGMLRDCSDYVVAKPHLAQANGLLISDKYGPIAAPFTKYDIPVHAQDRPVRNRYALERDLLDDVYEFLRIDFIPSQSLPHIGARTYLAIVIHAEIGARTSEVLGIRAEGKSCDVDLKKRRIRLFGKGAPFTGKRIRWVKISPFATQVLEVFLRVFKPMFPKTADSDYLFLNEDGTRQSKWWYWKTFRSVVERMIDAGLEVPADIRPHDLRRTWATNALEENPIAYRQVLKQMGHTYPSSAAPYLIATDEDVEEQQSDLLDIFIDPHINKWRKRNGS